jgi:hypothetical protein
MSEELEEPYEKAESWGQAVKGNEGFADRAFQEAGEPRLVRRNLTVEAVARVRLGVRLGVRSILYTNAGHSGRSRETLAQSSLEFSFGGKHGFKASGYHA